MTDRPLWLVKVAFQPPERAALVPRRTIWPSASGLAKVPAPTRTVSPGAKAGLLSAPLIVRHGALGVAHEFASAPAGETYQIAGDALATSTPHPSASTSIAATQATRTKEAANTLEKWRAALREPRIP